MIGKTLPRFLFATAVALLVVSCGRDNRNAGGYDRNEYRNGNGTKAAPSMTTVEMTADHQFKPREITVDVGETVSWKNTSRDVHTVSADTGLPAGVEPFHSGDVAPGASWSHTFSVAGTYPYVCRHHKDSGMTGTVTVRPQVQ